MIPDGLCGSPVWVGQCSTCERYGEAQAIIDHADVKRLRDTIRIGADEMWWGQLIMKEVADAKMFVTVC